MTRVRICAAEPPDLGKEFDFLVMGRFVRLSTRSHGLWMRNKSTRQGGAQISAL